MGLVELLSYFLLLSVCPHLWLPLSVLAQINSVLAAAVGFRAQQALAPNLIRRQSTVSVSSKASLPGSTELPSAAALHCMVQSCRFPWRGMICQNDSVPISASS